MKSRRLRLLLLAGLTLGVLVGITAEGGVRKDELECENAVQHLADCCGAQFTAQLDCSFVQGGCGAPNKYPELSAARSACIESMTCADVRQMGACTNWTTLCE